jgi:flagellar FliL protein
MAKEKKEQEKKKNNIMKIIIIIVFLATTIGASYIIWDKMMGGPSASLSSEKKAETANLELDEILVKLSDEERSRYIKTNIAISHDKEIENINDYTPQIRDSIINYLMSKKADDFSADNMENVKKDIMRILKNKIDNEGIYDIYFVNLIVQ